MRAVLQNTYWESLAASSWMADASIDHTFDILDYSANGPGEQPYHLFLHFQQRSSVIVHRSHTRFSHGYAVAMLGLFASVYSEQAR